MFGLVDGDEFAKNRRLSDRPSCLESVLPLKRKAPLRAKQGFFLLYDFSEIIISFVLADLLHDGRKHFCRSDVFFEAFAVYLDELQRIDGIIRHEGEGVSAELLSVRLGQNTHADLRAAAEIEIV